MTESYQKIKHTLIPRTDYKTSSTPALGNHLDVVVVVVENPCPVAQGPRSGTQPAAKREKRGSTRSTRRCHEGLLCKKLRFETYPRLLTGRYVSC